MADDKATTTAAVEKQPQTDTAKAPTADKAQTGEKATPAETKEANIE
jgi:hypothetical protein